MKTLNIIQTLSKIGKILSKIVYICCIIAAAGCVVGIVSLPFADTGIFKIDGVTIYSLIVNRGGIDLNSLYPFMAAVMIVCIGQALLAKNAQSYFSNELTSGTPFTTCGAKEMLRLGILTLVIPTVSAVLGSIAEGIIAGFIEIENAEVIELNFDNEASIVIGIMIILMSFLCKYGAECKENEETELQ